MAQTATMTKLRGRHYAAKARAAQIASNATTTTSAVSRATASNESLSRRLKSTRFENTRLYSPSRTRDSTENTNANNSDTNSDNYTNTNRTASRPSTNGRDRKPSRAAANSTNQTTLENAADREMELAKGISDRLDTGLNESALGAILDLLKRGEHPDAIVAVVTSLAQQSR